MGEHRRYVMRMIANTDICGAIIGKSGALIKELRRKCGAKIYIDTTKPNIPKSTIEISGMKEPVEMAVNLLVERMKEINDERNEKAAKRTGNKNKPYNTIEINFLFTRPVAGAVIGVSGKNYKRIRKESNAYLRIEQESLPRSNEKLTIVRGSYENTKKAVELVLEAYFEFYSDEIMRKTVYYEPQYGDFEQNANSSSYDPVGERGIPPGRYYEDMVAPYDPYDEANYSGRYVAHEPSVHSNYYLADEEEQQKHYIPIDEPYHPRGDRWENFPQSSSRYSREKENYIEYDKQVKIIGRKSRSRPEEELLTYPPKEDVTVRYPLNKGLIGVVIGRGGVNISKIRKETGVVIKVQKENPFDRTVVVTINGKKRDVRKALFKIERQIREY